MTRIINEKKKKHKQKISKLVLKILFKRINKFLNYLFINSHYNSELLQILKIISLINSRVFSFTEKNLSKLEWQK